ncbi:MAG TPA: hypothetical protein VGB45_12370 [Abditibacterium sp.]|jgi:hypothetical protein
MSLRVRGRENIHPALQTQAKLPQTEPKFRLGFALTFGGRDAPILVTRLIGYNGMCI